MKENLFIVPYDFTPVGDKALNYAIHISKNLNVEIQVVHIISNNKMADITHEKLEKFIAELPYNTNIKFSYQLLIGTIFTTIGKYVEEKNANLVIMGTHGMTGTQRLFGSFAIKVIDSTTVPFLIVQENTEISDVKTMALYVDTSRESMQIVNVASHFAYLLDAKVHVLYEASTDVLIRNKINIQRRVIEENYAQTNLNYEFIELAESGNSVKKIINHINENDVDMICITYHSEALFKQFDTFAQELITNKLRKPCLINSAVSAGSAYF